MAKANQPLAERMRPNELEDFVGQEHLVGKEGPIRQIIDSGKVPSMILWGPPGTGKTTLANLIANQLNLPFYTLSAVDSGVKQVRKVIETAKMQGGAILFIDEIHRFSKSQQDALLGAVEKGTISLIGATTENPSFEVIGPLLSRCQVYTLEHLSKSQLKALLQKSVEKDPFLKDKKIDIKEDAALLRLSGGDARKLYNLVELVVDGEDKEPIVFTNDKVIHYAQQKMTLYDKKGEQHYDIISAFIKSVRGSDPNAAVYWLARMLAGGEDPKFIARRLIILASEDIGNANPTALVMATNCFQAIERIGLPEGQIILSQTTTYLASSPKSNAAYMAINNANKEVKKSGDLQVPLHIRNAPTELMKEQGYGLDYKYAHNHPGHFVDQEYLPEKISGTKFYEPADNAREKEMRKRLKKYWGPKYDY